MFHVAKSVVIFHFSCVSKNDDMCEITICGMAFLWHQVRCMVSILFLIGLRLEKPEVSIRPKYHFF